MGEGIAMLALHPVVIADNDFTDLCLAAHQRRIGIVGPRQPGLLSLGNRRYSTGERH